MKWFSKMGKFLNVIRCSCIAFGHVNNEMIKELDVYLLYTIFCFKLMYKLPYVKFDLLSKDCFALDVVDVMASSRKYGKFGTILSITIIMLNWCSIGTKSLRNMNRIIFLGFSKDLTFIIIVIVIIVIIIIIIIYHCHGLGPMS